jgi:hypothetical protein
VIRVPAVLAGALALAGCGYVGPPLPPALDIPSRITDLRVIEYGDQIVAEFTIPPLTTEGLPLKNVRSVELRVGEKSFAVPATGPGPLRYEAPSQEWIGKDATVMVRATGPKGKTSDWSNPRTLPIRPPLAKPTDVKVTNVEQGVAVKWSGTSAHYRVLRASGDQEPQQVGESDHPEYVDATIEYGVTYRYYVQAIAGELQQSEVSNPAAVTTEDTFAPAVPAGVTAVAGVNTIELAWERNTEPDFKGYNVYRSVEGGPFERIAESIEAPSYTDRKVEAGKKYRYAVTAVDLKGNESPRSAVQEATAQ